MISPERQILLQLGEAMHEVHKFRANYYTDCDYDPHGEPFGVATMKVEKLLAFIEATAMSEEKDFIMTKLEME